MKAIIFNSGLGKRMGELTKNNHKSMVKLENGETIFERQIRLLSDAGIKDFVITTGPYEESFIEVSKRKEFEGLNFTFVNNPIYDKTNYIYSFYLARNEINDDFLMLHGDLVFNRGVVSYILENENKSTCLINASKSLPEKDFKGRIVDGRLKEVSINIFDENCYTFQPFYKLDKATICAWIDSVVDFIENKGIDSVYAENALNEITDRLNIAPISYSEHYVEEIDNVEDYTRVCREISIFDAKEQQTYYGLDSLEKVLKKNKINKPFVVIDSFLVGSATYELIKRSCDAVFFDKFQPNPLYEDASEARRLFIENGCDSLISIGGGSAIDTAKAVKLFLPLCECKNFLEQEKKYIPLKHIAIPTTAGTGSEATRFSVIYYEGKKQSLASPLILPEIVILDTGFLKTLPKRQKSATVLDALCQATEAMWSKNRTELSDSYAKEAILLIIENCKAYMNSLEESLEPIQRASNLSGKAINITQTTAAHAMSYKITSLFKIPHGSAVAMCMLPVWRYYNENSTDKEVKGRIAEAYGAKTINEALMLFEGVCDVLELERTVFATEEELDTLVKEVNPDRLKNYPVKLTSEDIYNLYSQILKTKEGK